MCSTLTCVTAFALIVMHAAAVDDFAFGIRRHARGRADCHRAARRCAPCAHRRPPTAITRSMVACSNTMASSERNTLQRHAAGAAGGRRRRQPSMPVVNDFKPCAQVFLVEQRPVRERSGHRAPIGRSRCVARAPACAAPVRPTQARRSVEVERPRPGQASRTGALVVERIAADECSVRARASS